MNSKTESLLGELLSVSKRIETKLSGTGVAGSTATPDSQIMSGISGDIVASLNEIKKETVKSNSLLKDIHTTLREIQSGKPSISMGDKSSDSLGKVFKSAAEAISKISKIDEKTLDKTSKTLKDSIMVVLLRDPKTGKEFATSKDIEQAQKAGNAINAISKGVLAFGGNMALYSIISIPAAAGAYMFGMTVKGLMGLLNKAEFSENVERGTKTLQQLGIAVATFGLTMAAFALVSPIMAQGVLGFVAALTVMSVTLLAMHATLTLGKKLGFMTPEDGKKSDTPLGTLYQLGMAVATFGLTMAVFGVAKDYIWNGMGVFGAVLGIALVSILGVHLLTNRGGDPTGKGGSPIGSLWKVGAGIAMFGAIMGILGIPQVNTMVMRGAEAMAKVMLFMFGGIILFGNKLVEKGTQNLQRAIIPLAGIVGVLAIYSMVSDKLTWESIGMLGAVVVGLGMSMAAAGAVASLIIPGAKSMILAAASLGIIAGSLYIYSKSTDKLTWESIGMLGAVILGLGTSMAAAGAVAWLIAPGAAVMLLAAAALYPITKSLETFSKIDWTDKNTESLKFAVGGVREAFAAGGVREWARAGFGALMASRMGASLVGLAGGIQSFANLSFTEFEYDQKTGRMIPVKTVKLTDRDIESAANNIGTVINALIQPLTDFGDMISGSAASGNWFQRRGIQRSSVERGMKSFATLGDGVSNLATGVQDWANMTITEWVVKNNELVPHKKRKLTPAELTNATTNISTVLSALIEPITEFGGIFEGKRGRGLFGFGKTDIEKGLESFSKISDSLSALGTGVQDWVNMKLITYKIKDDKLVPDTVNQLTPADLTKAGANLTTVLNSLVTPIITWSEGMRRSERKKLEAGYNQIENNKKAIDNIINIIKSSTEEIAKISKNADMAELENITNWFNRLTSINFVGFSTSFRSFPRDIDNLYKSFLPFTRGVTSQRFDAFTENIKALAGTHSEFDKFVTSFDKMTNSMERFTANFKGFMPEGITAFSMWTNSLIAAIEVGRSANEGLFDSFLEASNKAVSSAFEFGGNLLGRDASDAGDAGQSIIDQTIRGTSGPDPKMDLLLKTIAELKQEISSLKQVMQGEMNVYVTGIDNNASIKISDF